MALNGEAADIAKDLQSRHVIVIQRAVAQASELGLAGTELLLDALGTGSRFQRLAIAAAMGDTRGDAGPVALRSVLDASGPGSRDLRCAALLALAKRCGAEATPDLRRALESRDAAVREYAILGLAGAGDERAWPDVFAWLSRRMATKQSGREVSVPLPPVALAIAYLARTSDLQRGHLAQLVDLVRSNAGWLVSEERSWLKRHWPELLQLDLAAQDVSRPDQETLSQASRGVLFDPL